MTEKILLTGATGFIGQHFVNFLLADQYAVRCLIRDPQKTIHVHKHVEVFYADLTQPKDLLGVCEGIDTIFHLGGFAHATDDNPSVNAKHQQINFLGTKNIFQEALRAKVKKFIFVSSVKAVADAHHCINEEWQQLPQSAYGHAKRQTENYLLQQGQEHSLQISILRPALVYGSRWKGNLASMLRGIDKGFFPPLPKINNKRSLISVFDLYQAAKLSMLNPKASGQIYFVTDGKAYSTYDLYIAILSSLGKSKPKWHIPLIAFKCISSIGDLISKLTKKPFPFDSKVMEKLFGSAEYSSAKIQNELGFKPRDNFATVLPEIIAEYRNNK